MVTGDSMICPTQSTKIQCPLSTQRKKRDGAQMKVKTLRLSSLRSPQAITKPDSGRTCQQQGKERAGTWTGPFETRSERICLTTKKTDAAMSTPSKCSSVQPPYLLVENVKTCELFDQFESTNFTPPPITARLFLMSRKR
jgi:hypothetical protein